MKNQESLKKNIGSINTFNYFILVRRFSTTNNQQLLLCKRKFKYTQTLFHIKNFFLLNLFLNNFSIGFLKKFNKKIYLCNNIVLGCKISLLLPITSIIKPLLFFF